MHLFFVSSISLCDQQIFFRLKVTSFITPHFIFFSLSPYPSFFSDLLIEWKKTWENLPRSWLSIRIWVLSLPTICECDSLPCIIEKIYLTNCSPIWATCAADLDATHLPYPKRIFIFVWLHDIMHITASISTMFSLRSGEQEVSTRNSGRSVLKSKMVLSPWRNIWGLWF